MQYHVLNILISVCTAGLVTYIINRLLLYKNKKREARIAAILLRFWLIDIMSGIENFRLNFKKRLEVVNKTSPLSNILYDRQKVILVTQDFLYSNISSGLDKDLLKSLSFIGINCDKYEEMLQYLSVANQSRIKVIHYIERFHDLKKANFARFEPPANTHNRMVYSLIEDMDRIIPGWLEDIERSSDQLKIVFDNFNKFIFESFGIKKIGIEGPVPIDEILKKKSDFSSKDKLKDVPSSLE